MNDLLKDAFDSGDTSRLAARIVEDLRTAGVRVEDPDSRSPWLDNDDRAALLTVSASAVADDLPASPMRIMLQRHFASVSFRGRYCTGGNLASVARTLLASQASA